MYLDETVVDASLRRGVNAWTLGHAFEGTQVFGETGSGKTSGSGATIATAFLRRGFGGLVVTAKTTDVYDWVDPNQGFLAQAGIDSSDPNKVIVIGEKLTPDHRAPSSNAPLTLDTSKTFNFLDYEYRNGGEATYNLVQLFLTALEGGTQQTGGHGDAYWLDALRQLLTNAIDLVIYATGSVSLPDIQNVVLTAPQTQEQPRSATWQQSSICWRLLVSAQENIAKGKASDDPRVKELSESRSRNFRQVTDYWLVEFAGLADRTRSVIVSTFTSKATGLTRWPLYELLCATTVSHENFVDIVKAARDGKVVLINLPVKRYHEVGRFAQVLIKSVWQRGIERHPDPSRPVFLWADEAQYFATKEDVLFQTTARSAGCATVYLTQNISNFHTTMPGRDPRTATEALLGNLATKIFHANGEPTTNEWAERVFGKVPKSLTSSSSNFADRMEGRTENDDVAQYSISKTKTQQILPVIPAVEFTRLKKGGRENARQVGALIFQGGRVWKGPTANHNSIKVTFVQCGQERK